MWVYTPKYFQKSILSFWMSFSGSCVLAYVYRGLYGFLIFTLFNPTHISFWFFAHCLPPSFFWLIAVRNHSVGRYKPFHVSLYENLDIPVRGNPGCLDLVDPQTLTEQKVEPDSRQSSSTVISMARLESYLKVFFFITDFREAFWTNVPKDCFYVSKAYHPVNKHIFC